MVKESKSFIINYSCRNHESLLITTLLVLGLIFYYNKRGTLKNLVFFSYNKNTCKVFLKLPPLPWYYNEIKIKTFKKVNENKIKINFIIFMNILKSINKKRKKRNCIIKQIRIIILSLLHIVKNKLFRVRLKSALKNTFLFFELKKHKKHV